MLEIPIQSEMPILNEPGLYQLQTARDNLMTRQNYSGTGELLQKPTPVPPDVGSVDADWRLPDSYRSQFGVIDQYSTKNTRELDAVFEFCMYMLAQIMPASSPGQSNSDWMEPVSGSDSIFQIPATQANLTAPSLELARDQYWQIWNMAGLRLGGVPSENSLGSENAAAEVWRSRIRLSGPPLQAWLRFAQHAQVSGATKRLDPNALRQQRLLEVKAKSYMDQAALARLKSYFSVRSNYTANAIPADARRADGSIDQIGPDVRIDVNPGILASIVDLVSHGSPLTRLLDTKITPNWHVGHPFTEELVHWMMVERLEWVKEILAQSDLMAANGTEAFPVRTATVATGHLVPAGNRVVQWGIDPTSNRIYFSVPDAVLTGQGKWFPGTTARVFPFPDGSPSAIGFPGTQGANNHIDQNAPGGFALTVVDGTNGASADIVLVGTSDQGRLIVRLMQEVHVLEHILNTQAADAFWADFRRYAGPTNFFIFCVADFFASPTDVYKSIWGQEIDTGRSLNGVQRFTAGMMIGVNVLMGGVPGSAAVSGSATFLRNAIAKDALATAKTAMRDVDERITGAIADLAEGGQVVGRDAVKAGQGAVKQFGDALVQGILHHTAFLEMPIVDLVKSHCGLGRLGEQLAVRSGSQAGHANPIVGLEKAASHQVPSASALRASPTPKTSDALIGAAEDVPFAQRVVAMGEASALPTKQTCGLMDGVIQCFPAGTPVQQANGTWKPIETIVRGDLVRSRNQWTSDGEVTIRPVVATVASDARDTVQIQLLHGDGTEATIHCTADHPFWVTGSGWTSAKDLLPGSNLTGGDSAQVVSVTAVPGTVRVYNLEVEVDRTYFVASLSARGPPHAVWVHNANCVQRRMIEEQIKRQAQLAGVQISEKQTIEAISELTQRMAFFGGSGMLAQVKDIADPIIRKVVNRVVRNNPLSPVIYVREPQGALDAAARKYESTAVGAISDAASGDRVVPALGFRNPNASPNAKDFVKFDAPDIDNKFVFVDRKWNATTKPKQIRDIQRVREALSQNPEYSLRIEVPNPSARSAALRLLERAGLYNSSTGVITNPQFSVLIVPPGP